MELKLNIKGYFESEQELIDTVQRRKICYDSEPYYISSRKGGIVQIGYQLNLYGTFTEANRNVTPDDIEYREVQRDVRRVAEVLSNTCYPLHMCETTIVEAGSLTYSPERKMRPDVTVHIPVFDQDNFGHPVDEKIRNMLTVAGKLLESIGVRKIRWKE